MLAITGPIICSSCPRPCAPILPPLQLLGTRTIDSMRGNTEYSSYPMASWPIASHPSLPQSTPSHRTNRTTIQTRP